MSEKFVSERNLKFLLYEVFDAINRNFKDLYAQLSEGGGRASA